MEGERVLCNLCLTTHDSDSYGCRRSYGQVWEGTGWFSLSLTAYIRNTRNTIVRGAVHGYETGLVDLNEADAACRVSRALCNL